MTIRFDFFMPQMRMDFPTMVAKAQAAEAAGFDGIALMDHLAPPALPGHDSHDAFITAAALAAATSTLTISHLVLCGQFRHPALLAKMCVSLDHLAGGRFELGIGWGSVPTELATFGLGDERPATRAARLGETLEVLKQCFSGEAFTHHGRFFDLENAQQQPTPVGAMPIIVGGAGPKLTMPLVQRFADWWNVPSTAIANLDELRPLAGSAQVSTQQPVGLALSAAVRDETVATAERRFGFWGALIAGTVDEVVAELSAQVEAGVERFFVPFTDFGSLDTLDLFGREVIPAVRAAAAS